MSTSATARASSVRALAERHASERGPLLPILHDVMSEHGWIDDADIPVIAGVLNISRADVHGVVSFYHDFRRTPQPAHVIQICRGEACQSVGADALLTEARHRYQEDEDVEVREVFCLGNCVLGPSALVDGRLLGRLTAERLEDFLPAPERQP